MQPTKITDWRIPGILFVALAFAAIGFNIAYSEKLLGNCTVQMVDSLKNASSFSKTMLGILSALGVLMFLLGTFFPGELRKDYITTAFWQLNAKEKIITCAGLCFILALAPTAAILSPPYG